MNNDITLQEGVDFLRDAGKKLFTMGFDEDKPEKPEIEITRTGTPEEAASAHADAPMTFEMRCGICRT